MHVALIGGTGFVGGYLVDALLAAGHDVALLVRPGSKSKLHKADACRIVSGDLDDDAAIAALVTGADAVIYNVGILREFPSRGITFEALQYKGVVRTLEAARRHNVRRFLLMSANGVKLPGTAYQETKYRAERAVEGSGLDYTIFQPSVIFGDPRGAMEFATQLYRDMVKPPLPAAAFHTGWSAASGAVEMSPVHVEDVALAFVNALDDPETIGKTYALGGTEVLTWTEMLERIGKAAGKRKLVLPLPIGVMKLGATLFDWLPFFPVTRGQLTMLAEGNTADPAPLEQLIGREPKPFTEANLGYLAQA